jgi:hypothetical protein
MVLMIRDERIAAALAGVPESCRSSIEPVLRAFIHDLNGALSALTIEAFSIEHLAATLDNAIDARSSEETRRQLDNLRDSARNLRQAADGAADYLARVESLADDLRMIE